MKYFARKSNHIKEDLSRGWSSWNFGQDGFEGTRCELDDYLSSCTNERPCFISGFEIYPGARDEFSFGELYQDYWVAIDNVNAASGLSCIELNSSNLNDAIKEAELRTDYWGDGQSFKVSEVDLVYSSEDIHIFELK